MNTEPRYGAVWLIVPQPAPFAWRERLNEVTQVAGGVTVMGGKGTWFDNYGTEHTEPIAKYEWQAFDSIKLRQINAKVERCIELMLNQEQAVLSSMGMHTLED